MLRAPDAHGSTRSSHCSIPVHPDHFPSAANSSSQRNVQKKSRRSRFASASFRHPCFPELVCSVFHNDYAQSIMTMRFGIVSPKTPWCTVYCIAMEKQDASSGMASRSTNRLSFGSADGACIRVGAQCAHAPDQSDVSDGGDNRRLSSCCVCCKTR